MSSRKSLLFLGDQWARQENVVRAQRLYYTSVRSFGTGGSSKTRCEPVKPIKARQGRSQQSSTARQLRLGNRAVDHVAQNRAILQALFRALHHEYHEQIVRWVHPHVGATRAAPVILAGRGGIRRRDVRTVTDDRFRFI